GDVSDDEVISYARVLDSRRADIICSFKVGDYETDLEDGAYLELSTGECVLNSNHLIIKGLGACVIAYR
ncbi:MAG: hypothetical protein II929_02460, partial [Succinivibrio sp.]|nr:hypothetical protein [Succinivibrio sp.]